MKGTTGLGGISGRQQHLPKLKLRQRTRTCSSDSGVEVAFFHPLTFYPQFYTYLLFHPLTLYPQFCIHLLFHPPTFVRPPLPSLSSASPLSFSSGWERVPARLAGGHSHFPHFPHLHFPHFHFPQVGSESPQDLLEDTLTFFTFTFLTFTFLTYTLLTFTFLRLGVSPRKTCWRTLSMLGPAGLRGSSGRR